MFVWECSEPRSISGERSGWSCSGCSLRLLPSCGQREGTHSRFSMGWVSDGAFLFACQFFDGASQETQASIAVED